MHGYLDARQLQDHKWRNLLHSVGLIAGLTGLLCLISWLIWGFEIALGVLGGLMLGIGLRPTIPLSVIMYLYGARPLGQRAAPELGRIVRLLTQRAELINFPKLYYLPSRMMNAFAVGSRENSVICMTDGLLRRLDLRELAGVLAHEISHIRNNDLRIMGLADLLTRLTTVMSYIGMFLLVLNLPLILMSKAYVPFSAVLLLVFAPTISSLLQLGLSRAREYDADLDAAGLTGDPVGLSHPLEKLERYQGRFWEELVLPGRRIPEPSLLRTHPPTEERIRRLLALRPADRSSDLSAHRSIDPQWLGQVPRKPRYHWLGMWY